ncbi:MAG: sigma-70 family RNA polymerase sigma factor [Muribaculaceae bacterium]|nr:sigma-70 family RNA polymerase sigma factor [Muribaculaceae bacterium]
MATTPNPNHAAIEDYFRHSDKLRRYVGSRVNNEDDAADLVQEVFLRLLEYSGRIVTATVANLAFTIASRVINDYLRHHYVKTSVHHEISHLQVSTSNDTEETVIGRDMARLEHQRLESMPPQRRQIYIMRLHQGKSTKEISQILNISSRTAENHFYIGIRQMRACFLAAI